MLARDEKHAWVCGCLFLAAGLVTLGWLVVLCWPAFVVGRVLWGF